MAVINITWTITQRLSNLLFTFKIRTDVTFNKLQTRVWKIDKSKFNVHVFYFSVHRSVVRGRRGEGG